VTMPSPTDEPEPDRPVPERVEPTGPNEQQRADRDHRGRFQPGNKVPKAPHYLTSGLTSTERCWLSAVRIGLERANVGDRRRCTLLAREALWARRIVRHANTLPPAEQFAASQKVGKALRTLKRIDDMGGGGIVSSQDGDPLDDL